MNDVTQRHLESIGATLALLGAQMAALGHALNAQETPQAAPRLPRCQDVNPALCALTEDEARLDKRSFGAPNAWECRGCGHVGSDMEFAG